MAEASVPQDLSSYKYELSRPLPSGGEARDHVISKGPCQPKDIKFPLDNRNRKFLVAWYDKFPWLEYSVSLDKAFCFVCRVFNAQVSYCVCAYFVLLSSSLVKFLVLNSHYLICIYDLDCIVFNCTYQNAMCKL